MPKGYDPIVNEPTEDDPETGEGKARVESKTQEESNLQEVPVCSDDPLPPKQQDQPPPQSRSWKKIAAIVFFASAVLVAIASQQKPVRGAAADFISSPQVQEQLSKANSSLQAVKATCGKAKFVNATRGSFCKLAIKSQMPFYLQATQSFVSVLVNYFAFPTDLSKPPDAFGVIMAAVATGSFFGRFVQDVMEGAAAFLQAWANAICIPAAFFGTWFSLMPKGRHTPGTKKRKVDRQKLNQENLNRPPGSEDDPVPITNAEDDRPYRAGDRFVEAMQLGLSFLAGCGAAVVSFFVLQSVFAWMFSNHEHEHGYTCQTLRWSRAADQLPVIMSALNLIWADGAHPSRVVLGAPMILLSIMYIPPMALTGLFYISWGTIIFFPVALAVGTIALVMGKITMGMIAFTGRTKFDDVFGAKLLLVPAVVYIQFVGESTARFAMGESWYGSMHSTWAARHFANYGCHVFLKAHSPMLAVMTVVMLL